jgi:hypothetical protein
LEIRVSTILKALQRLEDEKSADTERSLDEQVVAHRPPPAPERRGLKIGAIAIGGLAVVAAAFLFWLTREESDAEVAMESPPPATAPTAATATKVAAEKPRRRPSARPAPAARERRDSSEVEVSSVVEVVELLDEPPADSAAPVVAPDRTTELAKAGTKRPARRRSERNRRPKNQDARGAGEPRPIEKRVADAKPPVAGISEKPEPAKPAPVPPAPVEVAAVAAKPAPTAASESIPAPIQKPEREVVQRAKLPELSIEKTIWHPDAFRRVAVVKLLDVEEVLHLKEGDAIGPLVVKTISPGSVLFDHDSIEVRYNVGS